MLYLFWSVTQSKDNKRKIYIPSANVECRAIHGILDQYLPDSFYLPQACAVNPK